MSTTSDTTETTLVATRPPFTTNPAADLILRSSDGERFYVMKAIMVAASPIFENMLTIGQPKPLHPRRSRDEGREDDEERPVIDMTEDTWTVSTLLRICYPVSNPPLSELGPLQCVMQLLDAWRKYSIAPIKDICKEYLLKYILPFDPMVVFVIACKYGLEDLAKAAAEGTMRCTQEQVLDCDRPEAGTMSFACFQRLRGFRKECQVVVWAVLDVKSCAAWASAKRLFSDAEVVSSPQAVQRRNPDLFAEIIAQHHSALFAGISASGLLQTHRDGSSSTSSNACCLTTTFTISDTESTIVSGWWVNYVNQLRTISADMCATGRSSAAEENTYYDAVERVIKCERCRKSFHLKDIEAFRTEVQQKLDNAIHTISENYQFTD